MPPFLYKLQPPYLGWRRGLSHTPTRCSDCGALDLRTGPPAGPSGRAGSGWGLARPWSLPRKSTSLWPTALTAHIRVPSPLKSISQTQNNWYLRKGGNWEADARGGLHVKTRAGVRVMPLLQRDAQGCQGASRRTGGAWNSSPPRAQKRPTLGLCLRLSASRTVR